jgi:hypothetical protein
MMKTPEQIIRYCRKRGFSDAYAQYASTHLWCEACRFEPAVLPHHLRTRGAHGDIDTPENLLSLCRWHHTYIDSIPHAIFIEHFPHLREKLEKAWSWKRS